MFMYLRMIHILIALSVLLSSTGVSIPKDFCMKKFVKSIVHTFKGGCGHEQQAKISHNNIENETAQTSCPLEDLTGFGCAKTPKNCPLKSFNIAKSDQDLNTVSFGFVLKNIDYQYFTPKVCRFFEKENCRNSKLLTYFNYRPPPLKRNIIVLFQNFRC